MKREEINPIRTFFIVAALMTMGVVSGYLLLIGQTVIGLLGIAVTILGFIGWRFPPVGPDAIDSALAEATVHADAGMFDESEGLIQQALVEEPDNPDAHAALGWLAFKRGAFSEAERHYSQSLRYDPDQERVLLMRAETYLRLGKWDAMLADAESVLRRWPESAQGYRAKAEALTHMDRHGEAMREVERALELNPRLPSAYHVRGKIYLERRAYDLAREDFYTFAELDPESAEALFLIAETFRMEGYAEEAILGYSDAIDALPAEPEPYYWRAELHFNLGEVEEAVEDYRTYLLLIDDRSTTEAKRARKRITAFEGGL